MNSVKNGETGELGPRWVCIFCGSDDFNYSMKGVQVFDIRKKITLRVVSYIPILR